LEKKWKENKGEDAPLPRYIKFAKILNNGPFGLKEHAVAAITASSASNGTASIEVFTTQNLYYPDNPLSPLLVILATLSIGLFGYGLTGLFRPVTVDNAESVYWSQIPLLSLLQNLHWSDLRTSKKLRWFWYAFGFMAIYQIIPGYMFPWLNSVSIPCLAAMHATGAKASILTNIFGGSLNNEGLGILNFSFDWQYVSTFDVVLSDGLDYFLLNITATGPSGQLDRWYPYLLRRHGCRLLRKRVGRTISTIHVDQVATTGWISIRYRIRFRRGCFEPGKTGRLWSSMAYIHLHLGFCRGQHGRTSHLPYVISC
jgi:hypothetical protein